MGVCHMKKIIALCLIAALLLTGCGSVDLAGYFDKLSGFFGDIVTEGGGKTAGGAGKDTRPASGYDGLRFEDIEYSRPDMAEFDRCLTRCCQTARTSDDISDVEDAVWEYYQTYDTFYTNYNLASIHYNRDLTDTHWQTEYAYCAENSAAVDAGLDALYRALAASPVREELESDDYFGAGFFDAYEGDGLWDDTFTALMAQEDALINEYYAVVTESLDTEYYSEAYFSAYGDRLAELLVELIALRQKIAAYAGYDSYTDFAYDFYYYRDYTPEEALTLTENIRRVLAPLYARVNSYEYWEEGYRDCSQEETYDFVRGCAEAMGGTVAEAFSQMADGGFYDIAYSDSKNNTSFEVYLTDYNTPYIFVCPDLINYDKLTFAHEFGHLFNDYSCYGSYAGIDVAEVFSQGMEYLSLCYTDGGEALERFKLVDCLSVYVEQAAYATFEQRMYDLKGDDLTAEGVAALYDEVCRGFHFDSYNWDNRDFVTVGHFYTDPMYIISYVVSNDLAFQLYQAEKAEPGAGLAIYTENADSESSYIVEFAESIGLESPFADGRVVAVRKSLAEILG